MKKRAISVLMAATMLLTLLPTAALADEIEQAQCACSVPCAGDGINLDCPVCGMEDADLSICQGTPAAAVQEGGSEENSPMGQDESNKMPLTEDGQKYYAIVGDLLMVSEQQLEQGQDYSYSNDTITLNTTAPITFSGGSMTASDEWLIGVTNLVVNKSTSLTFDGVKLKSVTLAEGIALSIVFKGENFIHNSRPGFGGDGAFILKENSSLRIDGTSAGLTSLQYPNGAGAFYGKPYTHSASVTIKGGTYAYSGGTDAQVFNGLKNVTIDDVELIARYGNRFCLIDELTVINCKLNIPYSSIVYNKFTVKDHSNITLQGEFNLYSRDTNDAATFENSVVDLGGNSKIYSETFSTGTSGNAVVYYNGSYNQLPPAEGSSCVYFEGKTATVYGDTTLPQDLEIPSGYTLTIPQNTTLTIPDGVTMTVKGTVEGQGSLAGDGTVKNMSSTAIRGDNVTVNVTGNPGTDEIFCGNLRLSGVSVGEGYTFSDNTCTITGTGITVSGGYDEKLKIEAASVTLDDFATAGMLTLTQTSTTITLGSDCRVDNLILPDNCTLNLQGTGKLWIYHSWWQSNTELPGDGVHILNLGENTELSIQHSLILTNGGSLKIAGAGKCTTGDNIQGADSGKPCTVELDENTNVQIGGSLRGGTGNTCKVTVGKGAILNVGDSIHGGDGFCPTWGPEGGGAGAALEMTVGENSFVLVGGSIHGGNGGAGGKASPSYGLYPGNGGTAAAMTMTVGQGAVVLVDGSIHGGDGGGYGYNPGGVAVKQGVGSDLSFTMQSSALVVAGGGVRAGTGQDQTTGETTTGNSTKTHSAGLLIENCIPTLSNDEKTLTLTANGPDAAGCLKSDYTLPYSLGIGENCTLTLEDNTTLTIQTGGTLTNEGTITGSGAVSVDKIICASDTIVNFKKDGQSVTEAAYGDTITIEVTAQKKQSAANTLRRTLNQVQVEFLLKGLIPVGTATATENAGVWTASTTLTIDHDFLTKLGGTMGSNSITAKFSGADLLLESTGTATFTVNKADQTPPAAPSKDSTDVTTSAITLAAISATGHGAVQYGYKTGSETDPDHWQTGTTFNSLSAGTAYTFYARYVGDTYYNEAVSSGATIHTVPAKPEASAVTIDYSAETISFAETLEGNSDSDFGSTTAISSGGSISSLIGTAETTIYARVKAVTDGAPASEAVAISLPARPSAPQNLLGVNETISGQSDGKITGTSTAMEYQLSTASDWIACTGTEITGLAAGTYKVRLKAVTTDGSKTFASEAAEVTVEPPSCTVTFDSKGGSDVASATVTDGGTVTKPADPTRSGYTFGGWYKESTYTTPWNFATDTVTANVTLYAKWTQNSSGGSSGSSSSRPSAKVDGAGGKVTTGSGTVTITPDAGYQIKSVTVNGKAVDIPKDGKLTGLKRTDKVVVTFEEIPETPAVDMSKYTDLDAGAWYFEAVRYVVEHGLFAGTSDTTFSPNSHMTRAMLMTVLARADGQDTTAPTGVKWYDAGMSWAKENGISDGTNPEGNITREQLAVMLYRYNRSPAVPNQLLDFTDVGELSDYAADAMRWAVSEGIVTGKGNGVLDPKGQATRAEVAAMLMRYLTGTTN